MQARGDSRQPGVLFYQFALGGEDCEIASPNTFEHISTKCNFFCTRPDEKDGCQQTKASTKASIESAQYNIATDISRAGLSNRLAASNLGTPFEGPQNCIPRGRYTTPSNTSQHQSRSQPSRRQNWSGLRPPGGRRRQHLMCSILVHGLWSRVHGSSGLVGQVGGGVVGAIDGK